MKMSITQTQFVEEFNNYNRREQFSYKALCEIFDYYEQIDEDYELDVIAICCEWTEYESLFEACQEYGTACEFNDDGSYYDVDENLGDIGSSVNYITLLNNGHVLIQD